jgi:hypothetical protein
LRLFSTLLAITLIDRRKKASRRRKLLRTPVRVNRRDAPPLAAYTLRLTPSRVEQIMNVSDNPSALNQIRKTPWKFQQTFQTPLDNLQAFVAAILLTASPETACITIDQVVFKPKHWIDLLTRYSLPPRYGKGVSITAVGREQVEELLHTAFIDWFDFLFVPTPKPFVIYADHDEYATFYANTRSNLNRVVEALSAKGFEKIAEYRRQL